MAAIWKCGVRAATARQTSSNTLKILSIKLIHIVDNSKYIN